MNVTVQKLFCYGCVLLIKAKTAFVFPNYIIYQNKLYLFTLVLHLLFLFSFFFSWTYVVNKRIPEILLWKNEHPISLLVAIN